MAEKYKKFLPVQSKTVERGAVMGVMIPLWYAVCLGLAAAYFGFWFGRSRNWGMIERIEAGETAGSGGLVREDAGSESPGKRLAGHSAERGGAGYGGEKGRVKTGAEKGRLGSGSGAGKGAGFYGGERRVTVSRGGDKYYGKNLFCPTGGRVMSFQEGEENGVRILTTESRLYSPVSGRILKISPRGNAFLIRTDWGGNVTVRACTNEDDLLDRYFRPRVVRGEIVRRGRLLLEYDRETLCRKCQDTAVYVSVGDENAGKLEIEEELTVKTGDSIRWLQPEDPS